jgi:hypothetical protein
VSYEARGVDRAYVPLTLTPRLTGQLLLPYIQAMFGFLNLCFTDQDRTEVIMKNAIGVLGDLAEAFPNGELKQPLSADWVQDGLKAARSRGATASELRRIARWAKEVCCLSILSYNAFLWLTMEHPGHSPGDPVNWESL